jgi:predicted unusual protein kinase regulating ubiquinone biosynthesis (AarF/ABC1/UbiB family)
VLHNRGWWKSTPDRLSARYIAFARAFVDVATRFRGGLIKLGQVASLRVDVIPDEITDELARLQDRVAPHPWDEIAEQLQRELGGSWEEHFDSIEREPIASASLGQVHRARSREGDDLAVKVLYPGIERSVAIDLAMTRLALAGFNPLAMADLNQLFRELRESLLGEMDYMREGRAAEEIARNLARDTDLWPHLRLPSIDWKTTRRRVLSMEYIEGVKINDTAALKAQGVEIDDLVHWATRSFLNMMFRDGFFHCDPHPGNLLVTPDGRLGIIDFGMNKRIGSEVLAAMRDNVIATVQRDAGAYADSLIALNVVRARDRETVMELAELSFDPEYFNLTPQELANLDFAQYFARMRVHMKKLRGFQLPDGIVMWSRAFSLLYGLSVELAPGLRPLDVIGPYVMGFLQGPASNTGAVAASKGE